MVLRFGWDCTLLLLVTGCPSAVTAAGFPPAYVSSDTPLHGVPLHHMQNSDCSLAGFVQCKKDSHRISPFSVVVVLPDSCCNGTTVEVGTEIVYQAAALTVSMIPPFVLMPVLVHSVFVLPHLYL